VACSGTSLRQELARAVRQQAALRLQTLREELVLPWFEPAPAPLTNTLPPEQLADADSQFVTVNGVRVHYKQTGSDASGHAILLLHGFNGSVFNW
jgi:hypothetical protein